MVRIKSFASHLTSALDGTEFPIGSGANLHHERPLWVAYRIAQIRSAVQPLDLARRAPDIWRYAEFLPISEDVVSLGEVMTPLLSCPRLGAELGLERLYIKDESHLPTGSFKARGMALAISMARARGVRRVAVPSAGNAGGAAAAYAARAGIECFVFMPRDTPEVNRAEAALYGARVFLVDGLIGDCGRIVRDGVATMGWLDLGTMREPYRLEGKKTMGFELAEQLGWHLPDAIFYPTGGGTGLIGMWKAFQELHSVGWLGGTRLPRLFACQSSACAPIVTAFDKGQRFVAPLDHTPHTIAAGLCVPKPIGDFMILDSVRASGGAALVAEESRIVHWMRRAASLEGIAVCPEAAVCLDALARAVVLGAVRPAESVVVFNTGAAQKYVECLRDEPPRLGPGPVDWGAATWESAGEEGEVA